MSIQQIFITSILVLLFIFHIAYETGDTLDIMQDITYIQMMRGKN